MKIIFTIAVSISLMAFTTSKAFAANAQMQDIEVLVDSLEADYQLNIRLIPQKGNSEEVWLEDLQRLAIILDHNTDSKPGEIKSLSCDKIVCRGGD